MASHASSHGAPSEVASVGSERRNSSNSVDESFLSVSEAFAAPTAGLLDDEVTSGKSRVAAKQLFPENHSPTPAAERPARPAYLARRATDGVSPRPTEATISLDTEGRPRGDSLPHNSYGAHGDSFRVHSPPESVYSTTSGPLLAEEGLDEASPAAGRMQAVELAHHTRSGDTPAGARPPLEQPIGPARRVTSTTVIHNEPSRRRNHFALSCKMKGPLAPLLPDERDHFAPLLQIERDHFALSCRWKGPLLPLSCG
ncbi:hypothetical protein CYMTET_32124 [Cymbomonas tetramitiformis]|uniref:Uncharacterized protein n=1 Tax=Cymbomonas tetramitiformis TaxID=36881 RepID=A0AAE0FFM4_9CHLO|nr:hypothetical protein CYMTET_32124 [Cymbomonas tetramitiformis]